MECDATATILDIKERERNNFPILASLTRSVSEGERFKRLPIHRVVKRSPSLTHFEVAQFGHRD